MKKEERLLGIVHKMKLNLEGITGVTVVTKERHCSLAAPFCLQCHMKGKNTSLEEGGKRNFHTLDPTFPFWGAAEQVKRCFPN